MRNWKIKKLKKEKEKKSFDQTFLKFGESSNNA